MSSRHGSERKKKKTKDRSACTPIEPETLRQEHPDNREDEDVKKTSETPPNPFKDWSVHVALFISLLALVAYFTQACVTRTAMRVDQRAWVSVTSESATADENQPIVTPLQFANTGKTPTIGLHGFIVSRFIGRTNTLSFDPHQEGSATIKIGSLFPNEKKIINFPLITTDAITKNPEPAIMTKLISEQADHGELFTVIFGRIEYDDIFGLPHWIQFCQFSTAISKERPIAAQSPPSKFGCIAYNNIDTTQP